MPKSVKILVEELKDKNWIVRSNAAEALGVLGDKIAIPCLIKALDDRELNIRYWAIWALEKLGENNGKKR